MKKYLIIQNEETETPTDFVASNGAFIKETVVCEIASEYDDKSPSKILWQWLSLNQIDYSLHKTPSGGFVAADGSEVWQLGESSADLPHLNMTILVSVVY